MRLALRAHRLGKDRRVAPPGHAMTVALDPPGVPRGELVAAFWRVLVEYFARRWVTTGCQWPCRSAQILVG